MFNSVFAHVPAKESNMKPVYKILRQFEWEEFNKNGDFVGSKDDIRDGFIHLATAEQVPRIVNKYFSKERPLFIVKFSNVNFLEQLIWEVSGSGDLYPHLYSTRILVEDIDSYKIIN